MYHTHSSELGQVSLGHVGCCQHRVGVQSLSREFYHRKDIIKIYRLEIQLYLTIEKVGSTRPKVETDDCQWPPHTISGQQARKRHLACVKKGRRRDWPLIEDVSGDPPESDPLQFNGQRRSWSRGQKRQQRAFAVRVSPMFRRAYPRRGHSRGCDDSEARLNVIRLETTRFSRYR